MMTTDRGRQRLAYILVGGLALLHLILAIVYANVTPYRTPGRLAVFKSRPWQDVPDIGAPDELAHDNYVINILRGDGLPIYQVNIPDPNHRGQTIRNPNLDQIYEHHQAPLYYLAAAGFGKLLGLDADSAANPLTGVRLRYVNSIFGACTVVGVFFLAIWGLRRKDIALLAASITALLPMNLALSGAVSNDPLLFCLCTWTLAVCALVTRDGWTLARYLALGILVGLALLTKTTALALLPIVLVVWIIRKPTVVGASTSFVCTVLLVAPWFMRNQRLYGDPIGLKSFQQLFAGELSTQDFIAAISGTPLNHWINYVGWFTARSFFGVFSYMDIFLNERGVSYTGPATDFGVAAPNTLYRVLIALAAIGTLGFFLALASDKDKIDRKFHLLNGIFLALVGILFIRYNVSFFQPQARYLYPAIGPISIGLALGAIYLAKSKKMWVIGSIFALLLLLNVYALTRLPGEFAKRMNPAPPNPVGTRFYPKRGTQLVGTPPAAPI